MALFQTTGSRGFEPALGTLNRADKGPIAPPPSLGGAPGAVADAVASWPSVIASMHWHLNDRSQIDGIDFYVGDHELGHIHLDGSIHLATPPNLGRALVDERLARPFRHVRGWVEAEITIIGEAAGIALFRRNYDRLIASSNGQSVGGVGANWEYRFDCLPPQG